MLDSMSRKDVFKLSSVDLLSTEIVSQGWSIHSSVRPYEQPHCSYRLRAVRLCQASHITYSNHIQQLNITTCSIVRLRSRWYSVPKREWLGKCHVKLAVSCFPLSRTYAQQKGFRPEWQLFNVNVDGWVSFSHLSHGRKWSLLIGM